MYMRPPYVVVTSYDVHMHLGAIPHFIRISPPTVAVLEPLHPPSLARVLLHSIVKFEDCIERISLNSHSKHNLQQLSLSTASPSLWQ